MWNYGQMAIIVAHKSDGHQCLSECRCVLYLYSSVKALVGLYIATSSTAKTRDKSGYRPRPYYSLKRVNKRDTRVSIHGNRVGPDWDQFDGHSQTGPGKLHVSARPPARAYTSVPVHLPASTVIATV